MKLDDMDQLNLFGLPLELYSRDTSKSAKDMQKTIQNLIQAALEKDSQGTFRDFGKRKAYAFYDPYSNENEFSYLRYEDELRLRASIVVDVQKKSLENLVKSQGELSFTDRERLNQINIMLTRLNDIKVIDAPVLLKLYNLYRYRIDQ